MSLVIVGGTIIDGVANAPIEGQSIWIDGDRIKAVGRRDELGVPAPAKVIDAHGKFVIPGLMNANVHLFAATSPERLARHLGHDGEIEEIIIEAAQLALKSGLTTVFDTWGPRRFLMAARDRINAGELPGSRIFCAGNIIGFDGPFSPDFRSGDKAAEVFSAALTRRTNAIWVENVGRHLMWLSPEQVASEVRTYIGKGIDFIKYASNEHTGTSAGAFLAFSPAVQATIVEEAHRAFLTAQAHTMSVEGLRIAIEAGCDLIQHANLTGPMPIPETTVQLLAQRRTGTVVFPYTQRRLALIMENAPDDHRTIFLASDINARNFIRSGATLLLANDGIVWAPETLTDPLYGKLAKVWGEEVGDDIPFQLATGHFAWFKAMEEKECPPMEMLKAATRNIAVAYGKENDLGTLLPGRIADVLILDKDPLQAAENYRSIHMIVKDGAIVDRGILPVKRVLTKPVEMPCEEEASYVSFFPKGGGFPMCPMCMCR